MDHIETVATSSRSAECTPVVLRESDRVRLLFKPTVIQNDGQPKACIRGEFVYEKKSARAEWAAANSESLNTIKSGEQFKLELHAGERLRLPWTPSCGVLFGEGGQVWPDGSGTAESSSLRRRRRAAVSPRAGRESCVFHRGARHRSQVG
ncbi:MAG: hypothetical protein ACKVS7_05355 [Gemmatimonadaceae bacterium]